MVERNLIGLDIKDSHCTFESANTSKIQDIMQDPTHPLHSSVVVNKSGRNVLLEPTVPLLFFFWFAGMINHFLYASIICVCVSYCSFTLLVLICLVVTLVFLGWL